MTTARTPVRAPRSYALAALAGAALSVTACGGSKELTVSAEGHVVQKGATDVLEIVVTTAPGANVRVHDTGYTQSFSATADFQGSATIVVNLPDPAVVKPTPPPPPPKYGNSSYSAPPVSPPPKSALLGPEIKLNVNVDSYERRKLFKPKYRSATTTVTVTRPAAVRYDPTTRQIACVAKACTGTFSLYQEARLDFSDIEPLVKVDLAGSKARTVTRQLSVSHDLATYLEQVPLQDMWKPYPMGNVDLPLELAFQDGTTVKTSVNVPANQLKPGLVAFLRKAQGAGVLFPGEERYPGKAASLVYVPSQLLFGKGEKVRDIDLVAFVEDKDHPGCGADTSVDGEVTVVERRTGKVLGQKRLSAPSCKDDYDDTAAQTFAKSFLKPG